MSKKMLIDATHPEETRVVVVDGDQLVDFDFETTTKKQIKGNIYLAKVTRVEPSLQAAFVDYGGNRHGFLAFSEIHPDYYQIPQADRELLDQLEQEVAERAAAEQDATVDEDGASAGSDVDDETVEVSDLARRRARILRSYKIQEVIKRRQILLVQVVKEERGNKGAALTTYLSLAGRYCVLMPNTPRGGGISRKISNPADRRRLKSITQELEVPLGMGLIVRTAGQERSKTEIKRDYEYLLRMWSDIRELTLQSVAPALIYEEGDLIKRAMRDLYSRDIEEVLVEGDEGYRAAKRLMQMLMPSRARKVRQFKDELPIFFSHDVEPQLDQMHTPTVALPSGGSIVIHATEALTAIDVNSGRSTRERHIDETAVKTNLEAADEVARQLRLRDLAGLVVIDFIDMSENRHQRQVERRMREALKADRARIQLGKISMFGLLELSRQRLRPSLQELSSQICPSCSGLGVVRSTESSALQILRMIQEQGIKGEASSIRLTLPTEVALYVLNQKREMLAHLEQRYAMHVLVEVDREMLPEDRRLEVIEKREVEGETEEAESSEQPTKKGRTTRTDKADEDKDQQERAQTATGDEDDDSSNRKRRRRRRRRRPKGDDATSEAPQQHASNEREETLGELHDQGAADQSRDNEHVSDELSPSIAARIVAKITGSQTIEPEPTPDVAADKVLSAGEPIEEPPASTVEVEQTEPQMPEPVGDTGVHIEPAAAQPTNGAVHDDETGAVADADEVVADPAPLTDQQELTEAPAETGPSGNGEDHQQESGAGTNEGEPQNKANDDGPKVDDPEEDHLAPLPENDSDPKPERQGWWSRWVR